MRHIHKLRRMLRHSAFVRLAYVGTNVALHATTAIFLITALEGTMLAVMIGSAYFISMLIVLDIEFERILNGD